MTEKMLAEIKAKAQQFVADNYEEPTPRDYLLIENAMLIGASTVYVFETEELKNGGILA
jgi:hypothetical protein